MGDVRGHRKCRVSPSDEREIHRQVDLAMHRLLAQLYGACNRMFPLHTGMQAAGRRRVRSAIRAFARRAIPE